MKNPRSAFSSTGGHFEWLEVVDELRTFYINNYLENELKSHYRRTHRKPLTRSWLAGEMQLRLAEVKFMPGSIHEPPRDTRLVPADGPAGSVDGLIL
jgi:hypothetical protein